MLYGNQIANAFSKLGFEKPKEKPRRDKTFTCKVCGGKMTKHPDENWMVCMNEECSAKTNYFIFDRK